MKRETVIFILFILIGFSCKKNTETESCGCDGPKTESIDKIFGVVIQTDDGFEILTDEKGLLLPCAGLADNVKTGFQPVIVSGTLKIPCGKISDDFSATPIKISNLQLQAASYNKTDITLTIIKSEDYGYSPGFGYFIEDKRPFGVLNILQPHIPVISGLTPFATPEQAAKAGLLVIYVLRKRPGLPSLNEEILKYINII